ncbi:MAG: HAD family hydrolase [Actinobacteria bacterium]|nr:HAD family hydrolase [Actinomycetota bacterium]
MARKERAVFIDRDGILNEMVFDENHGVLDSPFVPEHLHLKRGAGRFVAALNEAGIRAIVVTNQPGLAKGTLTEENLSAIHKKLAEGLAAEGGRLDGVYHCPHHPTGSPLGDSRYIRVCECRKPLPGLIKIAAEEHNVDLSQSYMIGDGITDIQAGKAAGCKTILVTKLKLDILELMVMRQRAFPDILVESLSKALDDILSGKVVHSFPKVGL